MFLPRQQEFAMDEVIEFLRSRRDAKMPGWKRMKIVESLMTFCIKVKNVSCG